VLRQSASNETQQKLTAVIGQAISRAFRNNDVPSTARICADIDTTRVTLIATKGGKLNLEVRTTTGYWMAECPPGEDWRTRGLVPESDESTLSRLARLIENTDFVPTK
jgi:hypothetical protein